MTTQKLDNKFEIDGNGEDQETSPIASNIRITNSPSDFNMDTLVSYIDNGDIKLPFFQRNYTWDQARASRLIESLIMKLPIPQIFLHDDKGNSGYQILDGQQRLLSIYFFSKERFPKDINKVREIFSHPKADRESALNEDHYFSDFKLKLKIKDGPKNRLHGLKCSDMEQEDQHSFRSRTIRTTIVDCIGDKDKEDSMIYELYHRLNTGGINLCAQEIRANLYYSKFYEKLYSMNTVCTWKNISGLKIPHRLMRDVEILLRAISLLVWEDKYAPPMVEFLNNFSKYAKSFDEKNLELLETIVGKFFESCSNLQNDAFVAENSKRFSPSLFEAVFVAQCHKLWKEQSSNIAIDPISMQQLRKIRADQDFQQTLLRGTYSKEYVNKRIAIAKDIMKNSA